MLIVVEQTCALPLNRNAEERINHIADDSEKKKKKHLFHRKHDVGPSGRGRSAFENAIL